MHTYIQANRHTPTHTVGFIVCIVIYCPTALLPPGNSHGHNITICSKVVGYIIYKHESTLKCQFIKLQNSLVLEIIQVVLVSFVETLRCLFLNIFEGILGNEHIGFLVELDSLS